MASGGREPKTSPRRINVALRRAEAIRMRLAGKSYPEIVAADLGYKSRAAAVQDVQRALAEYVGEPAAELRVLETTRLDEALQRLDEARAAVLEVMARRHVTVNNGRVIYLPGADGKDEPLLDDDPILRSVDRLLAIEDRRLRVMERRARLLGIDAPAKVEVLSDSAIDDEIRRLVAELERAEADQAEGTEAATP